jgi:hypothetical protein
LYGCPDRKSHQDEFENSGGVATLLFVCKLTTGAAALRRKVVVRSMQRQVDASRLRDMRAGFPDDSVIDIADYRQKHHDE